MLLLGRARAWLVLAVVHVVAAPDPEQDRSCGIWILHYRPQSHIRNSCPAVAIREIQFTVFTVPATRVGQSVRKP